MAENVVLVGNGVTAEILSGYIDNDPRFVVHAFSVDSDFLDGDSLYDRPVIDLNNLAEQFPPAEYKVIMAVGYGKLNKTRSDLYKTVTSLGFTPATYVHPEAHVHTNIPLGLGCIVLPGSVVEPFAEVGANAVVWANCTVAHHTKIGNHCWLASGSVVAGKSQVGDRTFIGVGATVSNGVHIAEDNLIGAHAFIGKDTTRNSVYLARNGEKHRFPATDYAKHLLA